MRICFYPDAIPGYKKFAQAIAVDNFVQADVRKIDTNLLPCTAQYPGQITVLSVSLPGGDRLQQQPVPQPAAVVTEPLTYINPSHGRSHRLDKMLSFDDEQQTLYEHPLPLVIVRGAVKRRWYWKK